MYFQRLATPRGLPKYAEIGGQTASIYLDLEDENDRAKLANPINLTKFIDWPAVKVSDAQKPFVIG